MPMRSISDWGGGLDRVISRDWRVLVRWGWVWFMGCHSVFCLLFDCVYIRLSWLFAIAEYIYMQPASTIATYMYTYLLWARIKYKNSISSATFSLVDGAAEYSTMYWGGQKSE